MSEDSDECRYYDPTSASSHNTTQVHVDSSCTSPSSPHRHQKLVSSYTTCTSSSNAYPLPCNSLTAVICSPTRRGSHESEGRFPSSPNDMCHVADLRKTALLRSVQMRAQPPVAHNDMQLNQGQEIGDNSELEASSEKTQEYEPGYRGQESEDDGIWACQNQNFTGAVKRRLEKGHKEEWVFFCIIHKNLSSVGIWCSVKIVTKSGQCTAQRWRRGGYLREGLFVKLFLRYWY